jgi:hypothetical protein
MTDELIARLSADLEPVRPMAMQRRLILAAIVGLAIAIVGSWFILHLMLGRPMGETFGGAMFWVKAGYTLAFSLVGLAALPVLARPDGRVLWPLLAAAALLLVALSLGTMNWMRADWAMLELMGNTAMVCPWLITLTGAPVLAVLLAALRTMAPRSPAMAGLAAGLMAGGLGAAVYSFYCGETSMMFMAVWYSLGISIVGALGAVLGRLLLRW